MFVLYENELDVVLLEFLDLHVRIGVKTCKFFPDEQVSPKRK